MMAPRRERFCQEYVIDFNAKQAAIRAGYSQQNPTQEGSRLLTYADVKIRVAELADGVTERAKLTADAVLADIATIKKSCIDTSPAIALKACELEAKLLGILTDRLDLNATVKGDFWIDFTKQNAKNNDTGEA